MELFGIAVTLLTGILTYLAWTNGRWMKQAHQDTLEILARIEKGQEEVRREVNETRREMAEARREMAEAIRHLGDLVVAEGEKSRLALKPS